MIARFLRIISFRTNILVWQIWSLFWQSDLVNHVAHRVWHRSQKTFRFDQLDLSPFWAVGFGKSRCPQGVTSVPKYVHNCIAENVGRTRQLWPWYVVIKNGHLVHQFRSFLRKQISFVHSVNFELGGTHGVSEHTGKGRIYYSWYKVDWQPCFTWKKFFFLGKSFASWEKVLLLFLVKILFIWQICPNGLFWSARFGKSRCLRGVT